MPLTPLNLMLKINLWMWCKVPQIKLKVLQFKSKQAQGPAVQNQVQGPAQVGQNMPVQPPQLQVPAQPSPVGSIMPAQPAPVQPVPIGQVVPAPQVFYQNWIGKKPEFSGKPEEDAELHLLSTRDWMEAHNFPNEVKVRHFQLTLRLRMCKKISYEFYHKELFLVKHKSKYCCESVIYFNLGSDIIKENCNVAYYLTKPILNLQYLMVEMRLFWQIGQTTNIWCVM